MTTYRDWDKAQSNVMNYRRAYDISQQALEVALRENRTKDECLEIAMKALRHYDRLGLAIPKKALAEIRARLAELEPETSDKEAKR